ncbi:hypothetical protein FRX31_007089 [Thalictrum thalictroides]|uniref:Uncharacterized protein n=1 Tax=Thalictrum thalictroides TaxID=46969 RepID=A0A7J6X0W0_THATH|nr:hypothetical protein FRX31_007089 [Thalictrum thalictroides]
MTWLDSVASFFSMTERQGFFEVDWTHRRCMESKYEDPVEAKRNAEERFRNYIQVLKESGLPIDENFEEEERKYFLRTVDISTRELDQQLEMLVGPKPVLVKLLEKARNVVKMINVSSSKEGNSY